MQPDPARAAETGEWLAKAALDLRAAEFEFTAIPPLTADIVYHCQQLAEKAMKGFLTWHDEPFRKTHSLVEVGGQCAALDTTLADIMRKAAGLTEYAWKFRYPGEPDEPPLTEAQTAFALVREVYDAILTRLPPEIRSR